MPSAQSAEMPLSSIQCDRTFELGQGTGLLSPSASVVPPKPHSVEPSGPVSALFASLFASSAKTRIAQAWLAPLRRSVS